MASTTEKGDGFRDAVCELLRTRYPDAQVEQRINGTKTDIVYTRDDDPSDPEIVAVECKDYATPLTKTYIEQKIFSKYHNLLQTGAVDKLVIVSRKPLGADASAFMMGWRFANHKTYDELAETIFGLRPYLRWLANLKPTGETTYIETRLHGVDGPAIDHVIQWVQKPASPALAILGGYGQGKTSFATKLASHYAEAHMKDAAERMPILIRLGEVVHETQLEGLFGKEFTAKFPVHGYQFQTLEHLNAAGRLLIILDGFDEMKHAMTASDFHSNFREFNRLLKGKAKVLLLGRPNALPSDERDLVFRGTQKFGSQEIRSASYASWIETKVAFFTIEESRTLLSSSLGRMMERNTTDGGLTYESGFLNSRTDEVFREVPFDLLQRPVHILIIAELASNPKFDLAGFNEFSLYAHFIKNLVERDTVEKRARKVISLEARLEFQRELAWWAWTRSGTSQGHFFRQEVPSNLLKGLPDGNAIDIEGKRNEYIVSTLTEEKEGGTLFFAHRSFQEFLVADRARLATATPATHVEHSLHLTQDVMSFLKQAPSLDFIIQWYSTLRGASGPFTLAYLDFFSEFPNLLMHITSELADDEIPKIDAWTVYILSQASLRELEGALPEQALVKFLVSVIEAATTPASAATAALALSSIDAGNGMLPAHTGSVVRALFTRCLLRSNVDDRSEALIVQSSDMDFSFKWLRTVTKVFPEAGKLHDVMIEFSFEELMAACTRELFPRKGEDAAENPFGVVETGKVQLAASRVYGDLGELAEGKNKTYLNQRSPSFSVIEVGERRNPSRGWAAKPKAQTR